MWTKEGKLCLSALFDQFILALTCLFNCNIFVTYILKFMCIEIFILSFLSLDVDKRGKAEPQKRKAESPPQKAVDRKGKTEPPKKKAEPKKKRAEPKKVLAKK